MGPTIGNWTRDCRTWLLILCPTFVALETDGFSLMPISLPVFRSLYENVIRDDVPGVVNANEEQE
jgi:hypothetical protein